MVKEKLEQKIKEYIKKHKTGPLWVILGCNASFELMDELQLYFGVLPKNPSWYKHPLVPRLQEALRGYYGLLRTTCLRGDPRQRNTISLGPYQPHLQRVVRRYPEPGVFCRTTYIERCVKYQK